MTAGRKLTWSCESLENRCQNAGLEGMPTTYQGLKSQDARARGAAPAGATRDNRYDFSTIRYFESELDPQQVIAKVAQVWEANGWEVGSDSLVLNDEAAEGMSG